MNKLIPVCAAIVSLFLAASLPSEALTVTFPLPQPPPNTPPALFPTPRGEWFVHFQNNLDLYKGPHDMIWDGDSITDFWQGTGRTVWKEHFSKINIADFGIGGDQVQHLLWRLQQGQLEGQDPKLVMLMIGTNNLVQDPKSVAEAIKMSVDGYEKGCPHAQVLLLGIFPRGASPTDPARAWIKQVNSIIWGYASDPRVTYLDIGDKFLQPDGTLTRDIMPDFLHPSAKGYEIWSNAITPIMNKYFPGQSSPVTDPSAPPPTK
jgi:lysophospholipase L1-like esterase